MATCTYVPTDRHVAAVGLTQDGQLAGNVGGHAVQGVAIADGETALACIHRLVAAAAREHQAVAERQAGEHHTAGIACWQGAGEAQHGLACVGTLALVADSCERGATCGERGGEVGCCQSGTAGGDDLAQSYFQCDRAAWLAKFFGDVVSVCIKHRNAGNHRLVDHVQRNHLGNRQASPVGSGKGDAAACGTDSGCATDYAIGKTQARWQAAAGVGQRVTGIYVGEHIGQIEVDGALTRHKRSATGGIRLDNGSFVDIGNGQGDRFFGVIACCIGGQHRESVAGFGFKVRVGGERDCSGATVDGEGKLPSPAPMPVLRL